MGSPYDNLLPTPQENDVNSKPITSSKTFWVNLVTAVAGAITAIGGSELIQDNPQMVGIAATVMGIVNIILRLVTKAPVTVK